jgi:acetylornithine deacetylase/succinyl-diaminopimelate desuccinylase-like protein
MIKRLIDLAIQIQQCPSPTFEEAQRAKLILNLFNAEGLSEVQSDVAGNVLACLPGTGSGAPLIVSAHLDTVFPMDTDLSTRHGEGRLYGPGIGDNSMGLAGLFGLMWVLRERGHRLAGDVWLVANTCEEGLGDLRGMRAVVDRFGSAPKAYLVLEGMALGHIYHRASSAQRYKISIHATGGHSWIDFGKPSAIHELAALITKISALKPPSRPHTTFNVGRIGGGTSINTIAAEAWLELDLRSEEQAVLNKLVGQVEDLVDGHKHPGVALSMEIIGQRPAGSISASHPIIRLAENCVREQGLDPTLTIGSTDANIPLSKGYPALVLGLTRGGGAHTINEFIETGPLAQGVEHLAQFVSRLWE